MKPGTVHGLEARASCIISHRYRFLCLVIPANAGAAWEDALCSERCAGTAHARQTIAPQFWDEYFTFALLRDPIDRLLTAYNELSLRMDDGKIPSRPFHRNSAPRVRFDAFLGDLESNGPWDDRLAPQTSFIQARKIDDWSCAEWMQEDLQRIYAKLEIGPCPRLPEADLYPQGTALHPNGLTREELSEDAVRRIDALYRVDTELIARVLPHRTDRHGAIQRIRAQSATTQLSIALADGSDYSLEIPATHPDLLRLLAELRSGSASDAQATLHQLPLDAGNAALTFRSSDLVACQVTSEALEASTPPREIEIHPPTFERATFPAGYDHDPWMNIVEGHLGGYMQSSASRVHGSVTAEHGDHATWYPKLWRWLIEELGVRSMLDVGCGEGHTTRFFRDAGCEAVGVDGSLLARAESVVHGRHVLHDFVDGPFVPQRSFDLVWSCEFVEHIEERFTHNFLSAFAASRKYLLMTYAAPGQDGWHHVNCQPQPYWLDKLRRLGFDLEPELTEKAQSLARRHFLHRGMVFVRRDQRPRSSFLPTIESPRPPADSDPLPIQPMPIVRHDGLDFLLFHDIFVHGREPKIVAVCSYYGDDWNPAEHGVDYDRVDLVCGSSRIRGTCLRHRLDSWEPCIALEFVDPALEEWIASKHEIRFTIECGNHSQEFTVSTAPPPAYEVAMSLVVRNENRWIRSFLEYYLTCLDASHVFVYDHHTEDRDGLLAILEPYRRRRQVTYIPWPFRWRNRIDHKMTAQPAQEAHSLARFANSKWLGFLDVDEFLRLPHSTLPGFLRRFDEAAVDGLSYGTRWFSYRGPKSFDEVDDAPLQYLYARRDELGRKRQKLFVKGGTTRFLRLHWLEDGGCELPIDDTEIFFHHYEQHADRFRSDQQSKAEHDPYMLRFHDLLSLADTRPRPQTESEWITHIEWALAAAERSESKLTQEVLDLDGMCGIRTRHLYNNLCGFYDCRYLEIGSFHGASTCAALFRNDVSALCIDHWRQFGGKRRRFEDAIRRFRGRSHVEIFEEDCFTADLSGSGPFDIYLYDGNHSEADQYAAIERFLPALARHAIVVIDDWIRPEVRAGTRRALRDLAVDVLFEKEVLPAPEEAADHDRESGRRGWWNGTLVMLVRSTNR